MEFSFELTLNQLIFNCLERLDLEIHVSDAVRHLESISTSTAEMAKKSVIDGPLFTAIAGAIIAAIAAYVVSHFHWSYTRRRENICAAARAMSETVNHLEVAAVAYWLLDYTRRDDNIYAREIAIKSMLRAQIGYFNQLSCLLKKRNIFTLKTNKKIENKLSNIRKRIDEDFDLISGNGFESSKKTADPVVAGKISQICATIKLDLSSIALEI